MSTNSLAIYLWGLGVLLALSIIVQHLTRKRDLVCLRNFYLAGFILFQLHSTAWVLYRRNPDPYPVDFLKSSGLEFALMATLFLLVFLFIYQMGWFARGLAHKLPISAATPSGPSLLILAVILTLAAVPLRFVWFLRYPVIGIVSNFLAVGFAAISAGMVGWVWGRRLFNPMMAVVGVLIVMMNVGVAIVAHFGRRPVVAVMAALLWGFYFTNWRYLKFRAMLSRVILIAALGVVVVAMFTAIRGRERMGAATVAQKMAGADVKRGLGLLGAGQQIGAASLWAIENYPEKFEYRHLMTLRYLFLNNVPRMWWPEKPKPLSSFIATQARIRYVRQEKITMPAGIIGYAAAEGGWYAVVVYAIFFGLFLRFFDELLLKNPFSPFAVLPVGCTIGQVVGLPRGDPSLFANNMIITFIGTWLLMTAMSKLLEMSAVSQYRHQATPVQSQAG